MLRSVRRVFLFRLLVVWTGCLLILSPETEAFYISNVFRSVQGLGLDPANTAANQSELMNTELEISFSSDDATLGTDDNMAFTAFTNVLDSVGRMVRATVRVTFGVPRYVYDNIFLGNVATNILTPSFAVATERNNPMQSEQPVFQATSLRSPDLVQTDLSGLVDPPEVRTIFAHGRENTENPEGITTDKGGGGAPLRHKWQAFDRTGRRQWNPERDPHLRWTQELAERRYRNRLLHHAEVMRQGVQALQEHRSALGLLRHHLFSGPVTKQPASGDVVDNNVPAYLVDAYQSAVTTGTAKTDEQLRIAKGNESFILQQIEMNANFTQTALQAVDTLVFVKSQTASFLDTVAQTNNITLEAQKQILTLTGAINLTTQQALTALQDAQSNTTVLLNQLQLAISSTTYDTQEQADMFQTLISNTLASSTAQLQSEAFIRANVDLELETIRKAIRTVNELRLSQTRNRMWAQNEADLTDILSLHGFQRVESQQRPTVRPLGFVPTTPGAPPYFLALTVIYTFQAYSTGPNATLFPDPDVPAATVSQLPIDAQNTYGALMLAASQRASPNTFVGLRGFYVQCSPDFLLEQQDMLLTPYNLMNMIGPAGCTPNVNCSCWVVVKSERCSTNLAAGFNATTPVVDTLADISGLCPDNTELTTWFNPPTNTGPDSSPTQVEGIYNLTSGIDLLNVLRGMCQIQLVNSLAPGSGGHFFLYTNSFAISSTQLGTFLPILNDPRYCSSNHREMMVQSALLGTDTLMSSFFLYLQVAAGLVFQTSLDKEIGKYGTGAALSTTIDHVPLHAYTPVYAPLDIEALTAAARSGANASSLDVASYLTRVRDAEVFTTLYTGPVTHPVFLRRFVRVEQEVTVELTYTDINGVDQTTTYTTDKVRRIETPVNPLPPAFHQIGSMDCVYSLCADYTVPLSNIVIDTPAAAVGARLLSDDPSPEVRKNSLLYYLDRAPQLVPDPDHPQQLIRPFFSDSDYLFPKPVMPLDTWLKQNNATRIEPQFASVSPHEFKIHLIQDPDTGYPRCDPTEVAKSAHGEGLMCRILRQTRILFPSDNLGALLDQERQTRFAPLQWQAVVRVSILGSELTIAPPLRLVCPDPNLVRIQTGATASAASGGAMASLQFQNTHSYPVLMLLLLYPSSDPQTLKTPRFTSATFGIASQQYWTNATANPSLVLSNVSCTRYLAQLTFARERVVWPLPLPTVCNNQNFALRLYAVDVTGFVPAVYLAGTSLATPSLAELLVMYKNATANATLARDRVQKCWENLAVNLSAVFRSQKNILYNGDVRTASTGAVGNQSATPLVGTQLNDLRAVPFDALSDTAAAALSSGTTVRSQIVQYNLLRSTATTLLLFNDTMALWNASLHDILALRNSQGANPLNSTSNLTALFNQLQALGMQTQQRQQISPYAPTQSTTSIESLEALRTASGQPLAEAWRRLRELEAQASNQTTLVQTFLHDLSLDDLRARVQDINQSNQEVQDTLTFVTNIYNLSFEKGIVNFSLAPYASELHTLVPYETTGAFSDMLGDLVDFAKKAAERFVGIVGKVIDLGENLLDLAVFLTKPDTNCFLGLKVMCTFASTARIIGFVALGVVGAGIAGFAIYKGVTGAQAAKQSKQLSDAIASTAPSSSSSAAPKKASGIAQAVKKALHIGGNNNNKPGQGRTKRGRKWRYEQQESQWERQNL